MLALLTCVFLFLHAFVAAEGGTFYNPPAMQNNHNYANNQVYELGEMVQLRWSTDIKRFDILLWQNNNTNPETLMKNETDRTKYNWLASTQRQLNKGNVFFFHIADTDNHTVFFQSHYFNLTDSSSTSSSSSHKSGLSPQAKVGIGVGVGLGGAFLITLAAVFWYFRRRLLRRSAAPAYAPADGDNIGPVASPNYETKELPCTMAPSQAQKLVEAPTDIAVEAPAQEIRHELP